MLWFNLFELLNPEPSCTQIYTDKDLICLTKVFLHFSDYYFLTLKPTINYLSPCVSKFYIFIVVVIIDNNLYIFLYIVYFSVFDVKCCHEF